MLIKEAHFTPQRMLAMLGLKGDSFGSHALIPGPKERSETILKLLERPQKNFTFLDYEMYTGSLDGKRITVGNGGRYAPDTAITTNSAGVMSTKIRLVSRMAGPKITDRASIPINGS